MPRRRQVLKYDVRFRNIKQIRLTHIQGSADRSGSLKIGVPVVQHRNGLTWYDQVTV